MEGLVVVGDEHRGLAGIINPSAFVGQGMKTHMAHRGGLLQVDDGIQGIAKEAQPAA